MDEMYSGFGLALLILFGLGITIIISYQVIKAASYGRKTWVEAQKQTKLLTEIARSSNVSSDTIKEILEEAQYKPKPIGE